MSPSLMKAVWNVVPAGSPVQKRRSNGSILEEDSASVTNMAKGGSRECGSSFA